MRSSATAFLTFGLLLCCLPAATATPLHWQLNGVTFNDGGQAFGGFDYDSSSDTYSNINITTTPGKLTQGGFYSSTAMFPNAVSSTYVYTVSTVPVFSGTTLTLSLSYSAPLTSGGGTVSFAGAAVESTCANTTCAMFTPLRTITAGTISAVSSTAPKRWFLSGVVLSDGTEVFGSFIFDATLGAYSSISITTTAGTSVPSTGYFTLSPVKSSGPSLNLVSSSVIVPLNTTTFSITFESGLGNSGGTVAITSVVEATCTSAGCGTNKTLRSAAVMGSVSTMEERGFTAILPQIADGGGFLTQLIITNPTGNAITCRLTFWQDDGTSMLLSLNGGSPSSSYVIQVPGHATKFLSTPGAGPSVTGWGLAENVSHLVVIAAFRLELPKLPESEATVEAVPGTVGFAVAFDESPGFDTGLALANPSAFDTAIENLYFYDTNGTLIFSDSSKTLGPHQHESFLLSSRYKTQLAGKRGTVRVYYGVEGTPASGALGLSGLGLRTNPGGTFTSLATTVNATL